MSLAPQHFDVSLKAFVIRDGRLLLLRDPHDGHWELPGGRVGIGEEFADPESVLRRELREELGEAIEVRIGAPMLAWCQPLARGTGEFAYLIGYRCELSSGEIRLSEEHDESAWVDAMESRALVLPGGFADALDRFWRLAPAPAMEREG